MKKSSVLNAFIAALCSVPLLMACRSTFPTPRTDIPEEKSVKPGINAEYLKPDLDPSKWVERFESEGREVYDQRHGIIEAAKIRRGATVADIGSGTGLFTPLLASAVGPKGKVYAVDIVPAFLKMIEERSEAAGIQNIETILCTERSLELPPNSIDQAFMCDVYHHFEYPRQSLTSLHTALKPGGEVFVIDFEREPGISSAWIFDHVRAGQEVVTREFEAAGFTQVEEVDILKDNYAIRFRKNG